MRMIEAGEKKQCNSTYSPIHGDLLDLVFARVSLIDLASVCHVSKLWEHSVFSSLLYFNKAKPWLFIHSQCKRSLKEKTTHAYDPRSDTWIQIIQPFSTKHVSPLGSSNSIPLYDLSSNGLFFCVDPLRLKWRHVAPPRAWRVDPIVALVGSHIVVAGGASGFEDDPLSVEVYDMETSQWYTCQSLPDIFKDSAASTWLSVAANQKLDEMYVTEKGSGVTYSFSTKTKSWVGPYELRPDPNVYYYTIGFAGEELILAGVIGHPRNPKSLKIWKIEPETMELDQIGEIPNELLVKLKGETAEVYSISVLTAKEFIYIYNNSEAAEIIFCEIGDGKCKWGSVKNLVMNDDVRIGERMVMSCGLVGIPDLHTALPSSNPKFLVKHRAG